MSTIQTKTSSSRGREDGLPAQLDLTYITERIIAVLFPLEGQETTYKSSIYDMVQMLKDKHGDNYMILNLSERRSDMHRLHKQVLDFGWPDNLSPPLERLCNICKSIDSWLNSNPKNAAVIHCKGGLGRMAVVIAAYIDYCNICASDDQALDQFAMKHFYDSKLARVIQPSQRRYVHYFAGLLSGAIKINNSSLFLHQIIIRGIPNFDGRGGCRPFIKIYQGMQPVYVSNVFTPSASSSFICVTLDPCLQLRSDVLVKCFNKPSSSSSVRDVIFRCQFHTCAVSNNLVKFGKSDIDEACDDTRFPDQGQVEFIFTSAPDRISKPYLASEIGTSLDRWNSYENFIHASEDSIVDGISGVRSTGDILLTEASMRGGTYSSETHTKNTSASATQSMPRMNSNVVPNGDSSHLLSPKSRTGSSTAQEYGTSSRSWMTSGTVKSVSSSSHQVQEKTGNEQEQLDEILKELLGDQLSMQDVPARPPSTPGYSLVPAAATPSRGTITTESDNVRTVLSWQTSQAGPTKSAMVMRQTVAEPSPHSKLESESMRYREMTSHQLAPDSDADRWGASERYSYEAPSYRESKQVETHSETVTREEIIDRSTQRQFLSPGEHTTYVRTPSPLHRGDIQALPMRSNSPRYMTSNQDEYLPHQKDTVRRTVSDYRRYASDSEDPVSWLEEQRSKLRPKHGARQPWKQRTAHEKQFLTELKSAQNAYYSTKRSVQSDTEDGAAYDRYDHRYPSYGPAYSLEEPMMDYHSQRTPEYNYDPKSRYLAPQGSRYTFSTMYRPPSAPIRSSAPTSPVIPERGDSSREAVLRSQTSAKEWLKSNDGYTMRYDDMTSPRQFDSDTEMQRTLQKQTLSSGQVGVPISKLGEVEEEVISLQPIGRGIQSLEPGINTKMIDKLSTSSYPVPANQFKMTNSISMPTSLSQVDREADFAVVQQSNIRPPSRGSGTLGYGQGYALNQPHQMSLGGYSAAENVAFQQSMHMDGTLMTPQQTGSMQTLQRRDIPMSQNGGIQTLQYARQQQGTQLSGIQSGFAPSGQQPLQHMSYSETRSASVTGQPCMTGVQKHYEYQSYQQQQQQGQPQFMEVSYGSSSTRRQPYAVEQTTGQHYQQQQPQMELREEPVRLQPNWGVSPISESSLQTGHQSYGTMQQQQQQQQHQMTQQKRQYMYSQEQSFAGSGTMGSEARTFSQGMQRSPSLGASFPISRNEQDSIRLMHKADSLGRGMSAIGQTTSSGIFHTGRTRAASVSSLADGTDGPNQTLRFIRDTSRLWHKENMTREEATAYLLDKPPGWFVVRNSNTYPGAYGLAVKVAHVPPNITIKRDSKTELVRHFLIEPTSRGVQLKGNPIEPVFATLAALVYQHTLTPLALPLRLVLPGVDENFGLLMDSNLSGSTSHLGATYAAFNVLYINSVDLESLTGPEAVSRAIDQTFSSSRGPPDAVEVNFKVSSIGITLTDNRRRLFFRRHYPINTLTYCGLDAKDRRWNFTSESGSTVSISRVFGFVARKQGSATDNACHLFAELDPNHSSAAIVSIIADATSNQGIFART